MAGAEFSHFHDGLQAQPLRVPQCFQAALDNVPGISGKPGQVSHQTKRCQIKLPGSLLGTAKTPIKFFGEFISNSGAG